MNFHKRESGLVKNKKKTPFPRTFLGPTQILRFDAGRSPLPQKVFFLFPSYFPLILASSSLPELERRSQGSIRGDAKKFALERARDFIVRFGLSDEFHGVEEPESRFKEVKSFALIQ